MSPGCELILVSWSRAAPSVLDNAGTDNDNS